MHVNLMPAPFRRQVLVRRSLTWWSVRWVACLLLCAVYLLGEYRQLAAKRIACDEVEARSQPIKRVVARSLELEGELKAVDDRRSELRRLTPNKKPLAVLAIVSQALEPARGKLQIQRLDFLQSPGLPVAAGSPAPPVVAGREQGRLIVEGIAVDDSAIAGFVEALRGFKVVRRVELQSSTTAEAAGQSGRRFEIVCSF